MILLNACKEEKLIELKQVQSVFYTQVEATFCQPEKTTFSGDTHFIYCIDDSASAQTNDPLKEMRLLALKDYVENDPDIQDNPNNRFMLLTFADITAKKIDWATSDQFAAQLQNNILDNVGFSNLQSCIEMAKVEIEELAKDLRYEAEKDGTRINFEVFLITDGYPNINGNRMASGPIYDSVDDLMDLEKNDSYKAVAKTKVHTIYYTGNPYSQNPQPDPEAEDLMQKIAERGNGKFVPFGNSLPEYNEFETPLAELEKSLSDVLVIPQNLRWNEKTKLLEIDSDGDGIPDTKEIELGSDPQQADTDQNGVADLVSLMTTGKVCTNEDCSIDDSINPLCLGYVREDYVSYNDMFENSDGDYLNNCDETLLKTDMFSVDSNKNFISDGIELLLGFNPSQNNLHLKDSDGDGLTDYQEIKRGQPYAIENSKILARNFIPMSLHLTQVEVDKKVCHKLVVDDVPFAGNKGNLSITFSMIDPIISPNSIYYYQAITGYQEGGRVIVGPDQFKEIKKEEETP
jgi:hypothetical protein